MARWRWRDPSPGRDKTLRRMADDGIVTWAQGTLRLAESRLNVIRDIITEDAPETTKALFAALVDGITVESRAAVKPTFRVPLPNGNGTAHETQEGVRELCRSVELRGFEPLTPSMRTRCATGLRHSPRTWSRVPSWAAIRRSRSIIR